ncbi:hypothetical protein [Candidatus Nitrosotalea sp. FS]|uniref:hypothetical protein n=1 Tax=Candidatus Nitrosotalea sp. FS TaxID=2341021 RepID=UPI00140A58D0|nr:hypothetical protein [Candidatus Nitrosotalea sp. FS]
MVKTITIVLVVASVAIAGIFVFLEMVPKTQTSVIQLSATVEITPGDVKVHSPEQLYDIDSSTIPLDNTTLDKIPTLKNAIDQAFARFTPPPYYRPHTFTTNINPNDVDSILQLAGGKAEQLPETQTNDTNFGVNFTTDTTSMEFKLNNLYYHVVIDQLNPS